MDGGMRMGAGERQTDETEKQDQENWEWEQATTCKGGRPEGKHQPKGGK